jgi:hypothetical protein
VPYARIYDRVAKVDDEVEKDEQDGDDEHDAHHFGVVARLDGANEIA